LLEKTAARGYCPDVKLSPRRSPIAAAIAAAALLGVFCAATVLPAAARAEQTVWLCKPGIDRNPCEPKFGTTLMSPTGTVLGVRHPRRQHFRKVDCFYVYPTVSDQARTNATLRIDPAERSIALYGAARYSPQCRVFAPMYRQVTIGALVTGTPVNNDLAYSDVLRAWRTYLRKYNHGRGVVLIGHSQGTWVLRRLIREQIDPSPAARRRIVSAILLGGNVAVAQGQDIGGDFQQVPACRSPSQIGCAIAFSTFNAPVPANALFGRATGGLQVLCNNPAALAGGPGPLKTVFPTKPFASFTTIRDSIDQIGFTPPRVATPWLEFDGAFSGECSSADGANVLQIAPAPGAPTLHPVPDANWGVHLVDANIALGNLTDVVRAESRVYVRTRHCRFSPRRGWFGCHGGV
jgi:pimeloyl-ACP methyl ester carboxylesterase